MKQLFIALCCLFAVFTASAQNSMKAKIEFEAAESAFADSNYEEALTKLNETEQILGKWTPTVSYLKIKTLDRISNFEAPKNIYNSQLIKEVDAYIAFGAKNPAAIVQEKYKEVYAIEKIISYFKNVEAWRKMPEYMAAKAAEKNDTTQVLILYKKAAGKGNVLAMQLVGRNYLGGWFGIGENSTEAINWFKMAANKGDINSMLSLYVVYKKLQSFDLAKSWIEKAASSGNIDAITLVAKSYDIGSNPFLKSGEESLKWFKIGADKGDVESIIRVAKTYSSGIGTTKSYEEAMKWYKKAAMLGSGRAMQEIGLLFHNGSGVSQDDNQALIWYKKAVENGDKSSMFYIAMVYKGQKNYTEAMKWYLKYVEMGGGYVAMESIAKMYEEGQGVAKDSKIAAEWRAKAEADKNQK